MTDTLLNKISKSSNNTIITDAWKTGQTGEIVDIKGDYVFRFIDFIDNGELRHKHTTEESKLTCPIVATGSSPLQITVGSTNSSNTSF